jgi:hypothetical protein
MSAGDWVGVGALAVAPTLAFIGAVYRAGQLAGKVEDLTEQVAELRGRIVSLGGLGGAGTTTAAAPCGEGGPAKSPAQSGGIRPVAFFSRAASPATVRAPIVSGRVGAVGARLTALGLMASADLAAHGVVVIVASATGPGATMHHGDSLRMRRTVVLARPVSRAISLVPIPAAAALRTRASLVAFSAAHCRRLAVAARIASRCNSALVAMPEIISYHR